MASDAQGACVRACVRAPGRRTLRVNCEVATEATKFSATRVLRRGARDSELLPAYVYPATDTGCPVSTGATSRGFSFLLPLALLAEAPEA